ncbi:MAG: SpoVA/SpoVAEb family sporulation membrane protein [Clostridiaceae bacterium]|nr:SpoVA/SpoVAEb family sporulation membrane protein [Clostridiaceae bacterium]
MRMSNEEYKKLYEGLSPPSPSYKNIPAAFLVGGIICTIAQWFKNFYLSRGFAESDVSSLVSMTMVFIGVALTAVGLFDKIAKFAGAGTLVPITGFANSVAAPALEFKTEGMILGTCVKMFSIAGPVIVFGISASVFYGLFLYFVG